VLGPVLALALLVSPAFAAEPDYSGWSDLLKKYVTVLHEKGKPWDSRFDYEQLYIDEGIWTKHRADGLAMLHTQLLSVAPSEMTPAERTAWAVNAYNFLVIERMTLYLLVPGRKFMRFDSPKQVNRDEGPFFAAPVAKVEGTNYSLTGFERRFVYGDTTADPVDNGGIARDKPGDPRLAFALCKASLCTGRCCRGCIAPTRWSASSIAPRARRWRCRRTSAPMRSRASWRPRTASSRSAPITGATSCPAWCRSSRSTARWRRGS
jgi:hypothetical protein